MYTARQICQMHYFRFMRTGRYDLQKRVRKEQLSNAKGYLMRYDPQHPLAMVGGLVYEHRAIVYAKYGDNLPPCELCGKPTSWKTCHIDHRDESTDNNAIDNLRPLCRPCNTGRTRRGPRFALAGEQKTLTELVALPGVQVTRKQAYIRLKAGQSIERALFGANKTHPRGAA